MLYYAMTTTVKGKEARPFSLTLCNTLANNTPDLAAAQIAAIADFPAATTIILRSLFFLEPPLPQTLTRRGRHPAPVNFSPNQPIRLYDGDSFTIYNSDQTARLVIRRQG